MKRKILLITLTLIIIITKGQAQLKKVNEPCNQMPCENGLHCVEMRDGKKKCSTCDQSKLENYTKEVDNYCKTFGEGWTPEGSAEYKDALAADGRALVDVYDIMLENAKKCKQARVNRERECWGDGDEEHKKAIEQISQSIERMAAHKYKMIDDRRVYYGSKSNYESYLSTFKSKCNLNFPDINQKLDISYNEQNNGKKVNCTDIENYSNDCEKCFEAAKTLLYYGFSNSTYKFPVEYNELYNNAEKTFKKAKELLESVKYKNLCN